MKEYGNQSHKFNQLIEKKKKPKAVQEDSPATKRVQRLKKFNEIMSPGTSISNLTDLKTGSPDSITKKSSVLRKTKWRNESDMINQLTKGNEFSSGVEGLTAQ